MPGFDGDVCQITTTFSFKGNSYISIDSERSEGFELSLRFRTTMADGLVAIGHSPSFFRLNLKNGRLNLHSSMLNIFEGIFIGEDLNDTEWQKVYVAFNISHLTIGINDRYQVIQPINPETPSQTAFRENFLGGVPNNGTLKLLAESTPDFVGCMQDISVNGIRVSEEDVRQNELGTPGISEYNTEKGCYRKDQCKPNPCKSGGNCTDLWRNYKCLCHRPFLGPSCQYNYTGATFGYENTTDSQVVVKVKEPNDYKDGIDLTMFIRTRKPTGIIFYLGIDPTNPVRNQIIGRLVNGALRIEARFSDKDPESFTLYSALLSNGYSHFIRVTRMKNQMTVKVNDTISIKQEISSVVPIVADYLYLGNLLVSGTTPTITPLEISTELPVSAPGVDTTMMIPDTTTFLPIALLDIQDTTMAIIEESPVTFMDSEEITTMEPLPVISRGVRQITTFPSGEELTFFKGVIQDVQLSNGSGVNKIVKMFELDFAENVIVEESLGEVTSLEIKKGVVSDNTCRVNPCLNGGECYVSWNDYKCKCGPGYMGRDCDEIEYCYWNQCPEGSTCTTLVDGFECITNATFNGVNDTIVFEPQITEASNINTITARFRTETGGTLLHVEGTDGNQLKIGIKNGQVETILPVSNNLRNFSFGSSVNDGFWHTIKIEDHGGIITGSVDGEQLNEHFLEGNDTQLEILPFILGSRVAVGSEFNLDRFYDFFRGCAGEMRIGSILLPYFTETEMVNITSSNRFVVTNSNNVRKNECVLCYQHECENSGVCEDPSEKFECSCPPGFDGGTCSRNIDECANSSCIHGSCVDGINQYTCQCIHGWIGQFCQEDKDECEDEPCKNGGTCQQTVEPGSYECTCTEEYKGQNCESLKVRTCNETPCVNGGTCIDEPDSTSSERYRCDCPQGYEGFNCDTQINFCVKLNANCQNGGTCNSDFSTFVSIYF